MVSVFVLCNNACCVYRSTVSVVVFNIATQGDNGDSTTLTSKKYSIINTYINYIQYHLLLLFVCRSRTTEAAAKVVLCCCGCGADATTSAHSCIRNKTKMMSYCSAPGSVEGYGSQSLCRTCYLQTR